MSLAAWIPSSLSAFSITLLRSRACRSSALIEQPIVQLGVRRSCVKKDETRAAMSQACRPGRRSVQRRRRRRPTDDLRTTVRRRRRSAAKSDESSAVRRADLSSSIPPEIRRILSDTDSDYANVASNMRRACVRRRRARTPAPAAAAARRARRGRQQRREDVGTARTPEVCRLAGGLNTRIRSYCRIRSRPAKPGLHLCHRKLQIRTTDKVYVRNVVSSV